jgi:tetratricopeptide (TPR) repeat protein
MNVKRSLCDKLVIMITALVCASGLGHTAAPSGTSLINGVEVVAELSKTELLVGEPLFLKIRVTNRNAPLVIGNFMSALHFPEGGDIEMQVQPPTDLAYRYQAHEDPAVFATIEIGNKPGASTHFELPIIYERKSATGYLFDNPGEYVVSVKIWHSIMRDQKRTFTEIPPTRIVVRRPEGNDLEAFRLIEGKKYALALQQQFSDDADVLSRFTRVAQQYPQTAYAPMCQYVAGASLMLDAKRIEEGVTLLRDFARRNPGHPMVSNGYYSIFFGYHMAGNYDRAREWFYYLMDFDPAYRLMREENKLAAYYYFGRVEEVQKRRWWLHDKPWALPKEMPAPSQGEMGVAQ